MKSSGQWSVVSCQLPVNKTLSRKLFFPGNVAQATAPIPADAHYETIDECKVPAWGTEASQQGGVLVLMDRYAQHSENIIVWRNLCYPGIEERIRLQEQNLWGIFSGVRGNKKSFFDGGGQGCCTIVVNLAGYKP